MEIQEALENIKEPEKVQCEKCKKSRMATKFCQDCGKFVCEKCVEMHSEWDEFSNHEMVSMEQVQSNVKQLVPPKKVTLYCSLHEGKELDLYCEVCGELICLLCTIKKHKDHQYNPVGDIFQKHKAEITTSLQPVEKQLSMVNQSLEQFGLRSKELDDLEVVLETNIQQEIGKLHEILEARKAELVGQMKQFIHTKKKNLAAQKDEVEIVRTQLASCLSFVRESLRTGSQGEMMKIKKGVMKQIKEITNNFKPDMLPPYELADVKFIAPSELSQACQQFGDVYIPRVSPEKCYATCKGLKVAKLGERATAVLHVVDQAGEAYDEQNDIPACELVSESTGEKVVCSVKKTEASGQYEINYQASNRGRHQLHIKVEGEYIKGNPFPVSVKLPVKKLGTPIKIITGVECPRGVAVNRRGEVILAETDAYCISIFSPTGEKLRSFGSRGSGPGQFNYPRGVAVDDGDNIWVADYDDYYHRIQKFKPDGKFITSVGKKGRNPLEFSEPMGIAIHQLNNRVYIVEHGNHRVQILNPDLTFSSSFGREGSSNGQFKNPRDVAFDSTGNTYMVDCGNHRIQVFTAEGQFLRKFAMGRGSGKGQLNTPTSISIDSEDVVYVSEHGNNRISVFTCGGKFLTSFGTKGSGPGQFNAPRGITVDKNEVVYVSDTENHHLQIF